MVNYKVRCFHEPESDAVGADVIIYSDEGDKIDTILVTTEAKYNELVEQLKDIDETYMDQSEVERLLLNEKGNLVINATTLAGNNVDNFSLVGHDHGSIYSPRNHASVTKDFGVGDKSNYGHVKLVDALNTTQFNSGEALSAYQGNVLKGLIDKVSSSVDGEVVRKFNNPTGNADACRVILRKIGSTVLGKLAVDFTVDKVNVGKDLEISRTLIPTGFRPAGREYFSVAEYNSGDNMLLRFDADGRIYARNNCTRRQHVYTSIFWFTDDFIGGD